MNLRPYQKACADSIMNEWKEYASTLAVIFTGGGKTLLAAEICRRVFPAKTLFLAHRRELIHQAQEKIEHYTGLKCEVEMGDQRTVDTDLFGDTRVVISSIQTQCSGGDGGGRMGKFNPMNYGCVICDEAHHSTSDTWKRVINYYKSNPNLKILGITATPDRADEEALGQVFESVAFDYDIIDGIADGWLVDIYQQFVQINSIDLSQVNTTAGDLNGAELSAVLEQEKNLHGIAGAAIDNIGNQCTIIFTASVKQAEILSSILNRHRLGMANWVCGKTPEPQRKQILSDFKSGKTQVICNCNVLTEGFDHPAVQVVVMARPTLSRSLYAQMIGRCDRPLPGIVDGPETPAERKLAIAASPKTHCTVLDCVGNSGKHKLVTTADILGGHLSEETKLRAVNWAKIRGKPVRIESILAEEEEKRQAEAEERRRREEAHKMKLLAKVQWSSKSVDPFNILQCSPVKPRAWDEGKLLTFKQRRLLLTQGIDPDRVTYSQGKQLVGEIIRRFEGKLCSYKQAAILKKNGYDTNVSAQQASEIIGKIAANKWKRINA